MVKNKVKTKRSENIGELVEWLKNNCPKDQMLIAQNFTDEIPCSLRTIQIRLPRAFFLYTPMVFKTSGLYS